MQCFQDCAGAHRLDSSCVAAAEELLQVGEGLEDPVANPSRAQAVGSLRTRLVIKARKGKMSKPSKLVNVSRAQSQRAQKQLKLRLAFENRRPMDVVISFDDVETIARFFGQMALAVRASQAEACRWNAGQCERTATLATDGEAKCIYNELARQWREQAERA
jgi:hypothetical protein